MQGSYGEDAERCRGAAEKMRRDARELRRRCGRNGEERKRKRGKMKGKPRREDFNREESLRNAWHLWYDL